MPRASRPVSPRPARDSEAMRTAILLCDEDTWKLQEALGDQAALPRSPNPQMTGSGPERKPSVPSPWFCSRSTTFLRNCGSDPSEVARLLKAGTVLHFLHSRARASVLVLAANKYLLKLNRNSSVGRSLLAGSGPTAVP